MPIPKLPNEPGWTEDDIQRARLRGRKLALDRFIATPGEKLRFDADDAFDLVEAEGMFAGRSEKTRVTMAYELLDGATRFHAELGAVAGS